MLGFTGSAAEIVHASAEWWESRGLRFGPIPVVEGSSELDQWTGAIAFPAVHVQRAQSDRLLALAAYGEHAEVPRAVLDAMTDRPEVPYLLLLDDGMPVWTRGLTVSGLRTALLEHDRVGLSVYEYLVLQRLAYERHGDHRFDTYTGDPTGWTWLPASVEGGLQAMAYYSAAKDRVEIAACKAGSKNPRKGAHVARLVQL